MLKIQLVKSGKFLVLKKDGTLTIELHTTIFNNQDSLFGSFSYPMEAPLEPNRAMLNNSHYIATESKLRTVDIVMWLDALPWKQCKMSFTFQDDTVQCNCYIDLTLLANQLTNTLLYQLGLSGSPGTEINVESQTGLQAYMLSTVTAAPGVMPMVFAPYRNDNAYKPVAAPAMVYQGNYNATTNTPALRNTSGGLLPIGAVAGWVYKVTVGGSRDFGGGVDDFFAGDYIAFDQDGLWYRTAQPYGLRVAGFSDLAFPQNPIVNSWEMDALGNGSFKVDPVSVSGLYCQNQTPFFYLSFMIKRICAYFGLVPYGKVLQEDYFNRVVIWSRIALDKSNVLADAPFYMPNISVADFLKEVRTQFGIIIDPDVTSGTCLVESLINLTTTNNTVDLRPNQVRTYREVANTPTYYLVTQPVDGDDKAFAANTPPVPLQIGDISTGVTETDIALASVPTFMTTEVAQSDALLTTPVLANWRIPKIDVNLYGAVPLEDIDNVAYADTNNFKLRFLVWYGMVPNSSGFPYPYVSADNQSVTGPALSSFTLSLTPGASDYSALRFYYNFALNSKPFEMGMELSQRQISKLKANTKVLVYDPYDLTTTVNCVIDMVAADLTADQKLIPATLTLWPKVLPTNTAPVAITPPFTPPTPPFDNGLVYVRFIMDNPTEVDTVHPTDAHSFFKDVRVEFFSDLPGTVPKSVTDLSVGYSTAETHHTSLGDDVSPTVFTYVNCNGTGFMLQATAPTSETIFDTGGESFVWVYGVLGSVYYTIIT